MVEITPEQQQQLEAFADDIFSDLTARYPNLGSDVARKAAMAAAGDMVGFAPLLSKVSEEGAKEVSIIAVEALK